MGGICVDMEVDESKMERRDAPPDAGLRSWQLEHPELGTMGGQSLRTQSIQITWQRHGWNMLALK